MEAKKLAFYWIYDANDKVLASKFIRVNPKVTSFRAAIRERIKSFPTAHYAEYMISGQRKKYTIANF